ncbi:hypothetical protein AFLA_007991 [Aspergillus flavus NRRL3357]|nr:hypothetical protein AFLA_007991 [Aspergillus flavus NRRL3357]
MDPRTFKKMGLDIGIIEDVKMTKCLSWRESNAAIRRSVDEKDAPPCHSLALAECYPFCMRRCAQLEIDSIVDIRCCILRGNW